MSVFSTHPEYSAWIAASAGTGKTKLLTDRILNLLLYGIDPKSILCLTFTKAAKGEMLSRINSALIMFSQKNDDEIGAYFKNNLNKILSKEEISKVKSLYKTYSSSTEKIQIYTIHAFCQNLLQKFPKEAGIKPFFQVIDEVQTSIILRKIIESKETISNISRRLNRAISNFSLNKILSEYVDFYSNNGYSSYQIANDKMKLILEDYFAEFLIPDEGKAEIELKSFLKATCNDFSKEKDLPIIDILLNYQQDLSGKLNDNSKILEFFLTKTGEKRKKLLPKNIINKNPKIEEIFFRIQDQVFQIYLSSETKDGIETNIDLGVISREVFKAYCEHKEYNNFLDYQDLITKSYNLLCNSDLKDWIKYKLDGGIDHILVDESQDTSEMQWSIIRALIEDFFAGETYKDSMKRTIFVVGDVKQSIYSFQGARPDLFNNIKEIIKLKALESGANFIDLNLAKTYRLPVPVFEFVYNVFDKIGFIEDVARLDCHHKDHYSSIEIWELEKNDEKQKYFWPTPDLLDNHDDPSQRIAKRIAKYIRDTIDSGLYLDSQKRCVNQSDFLILVQKRSKLNNFLYKEIIDVGVEISGLDRLELTENIVIKDIISCAKFIVDPKDNLNLACLLKSVFINLNDEEIAEFKNEEIWSESVKKYSDKAARSIDQISDIYNKFNGKEFFSRLIEEFEILEFLRQTNQEEHLDALKSFLNQLSFIYQYSPHYGINDIINLFETSEISIKRDFSQVSSVRITTIHGAKGLEAPIVILADSNDLGIGNNNSLILASHQGLEIPIWASKFSNSKIDALKNEIKLANYNEYLRLLYVALTRAQDHLVIAGEENTKTNENFQTWYEICKKAASNYFVEEEGKLVFACGEAKYSPKVSISGDDIVIPAFLEPGSSLNPAQPQKNISSKLCLQNISTGFRIKSGMTVDVNNIGEQLRKPFNFDNNAAKVGEFFHKVLELYTDDNMSLDEIFSSNLARNIPNEDLLEIKEILSKCLENEYFIYLNGLNHKSELEIAIKTLEDKIELKRIDFVAFNEKDKEIIIIDYKSDKTRGEKKKYIDQLNSYRDIMSNIFKDYRIETKIFWLRDNVFEVV